MDGFDPALIREDTPEQRASREKVEAFILKWLREDPLLPRLKDLAARMATPPQGFDTWEDYYKYGDAFIPVTEAPSTELAIVPKSDDP